MDIDALIRALEAIDGDEYESSKEFLETNDRSHPEYEYRHGYVDGHGDAIRAAVETAKRLAGRP